ncbi:MAG TPA: hypothetical protein P5161_05060, partial [Eubacteriales bacterium]|nr:hypothetical protein [Eubacteriales bacterium]
LIERGKLDYIAMDIKAPIEKYPLISPGADGSAALSSIKLIMESGVDHEFRTTFYPELTPTDIEEIAKLIAGAKRYFLQQYNPTEFCKTPPHTKEMLNWAAGVANKYVNTKVRGN